MNNPDLYEKYHKGRRTQTKIISEYNFTYRNLIKLTSSIKNKSILDVGSGSGTLDFYLASKGNKITGIEVSKTAANKAKESAKALGLLDRTTFIYGDFLKKDIPGKYDFVLCFEVLEHLRDDKAALIKIHDLLKKDGKLFLSVPSRNAPLYKLGLVKGFDKRVGHLRRYDVNEIESLLASNGFMIRNVFKKEGILRNSLFVFSFGSIIVRLANKIRIISDLLTALDNLTVLLFGESDILIKAEKK